MHMGRQRVASSSESPAGERAGSGAWGVHAGLVRAGKPRGPTDQNTDLSVLGPASCLRKSHRCAAALSAPRSTVLQHRPPRVGALHDCLCSRLDRAAGRHSPCPAHQWTRRRCVPARSDLRERKDHTRAGRHVLWPGRDPVCRPRMSARGDKGHRHSEVEQRAVSSAWRRTRRSCSSCGCQSAERSSLLHPRAVVTHDRRGASTTASLRRHSTHAPLVFAPGIIHGVANRPDLSHSDCSVTRWRWT
jgi:hypothetical protein